MVQRMKVQNATRHEDLRRMLEETRARAEDDLLSRRRGARRQQLQGVVDVIEQSDTGAQQEFDLAMLEMRAATLERIDQALVRLDIGAYGACVECAGRIPVGRLRAQPLAVRCVPCEAKREHEGRLHQVERSGAAPFGMTTG